MTDLQGAVARAQLAKLGGVVARRQASAARLTHQLSALPGLTLPRPGRRATHVFWKYPLIVDPAVICGGADALGSALKAQGVFCAPRYIQKPAFMCQVFTERRTFGTSRYPWASRVRDGGSDVTYDPADYPNTMRGLERVVVLPWNEFYTERHVDFIADAVRTAVRTLGRLRATA
jgi:dTDP-4-amino-4,6-dideoxygalactose transaminase